MSRIFVQGHFDSILQSDGQYRLDLFSLIRKILHLCMRPSAVECCTPGETEHCSTADFSCSAAMQCLLFIYSPVVIVQISALCYQRLVFSVPLETPGFYWLVEVDCVSAQHVSRMFFLPRGLISTLSHSLSLPTPHGPGHMKSDAWQKFRL